jgi:hypothetical protein
MCADMRAATLILGNAKKTASFYRAIDSIDWNIFKGF